MLDGALPSFILTDRELAIINAISVVWPLAQHLLCRWHIAMNVFKHSKQYLPSTEDHKQFMTDWTTTIVEASSEDEFETAWIAFESKYGHKAMPAIDYIRDNWLEWRSRFCAAWTDQWPHLGQVNTSRIEGSHRALKTRLHSTKGNLLAVYTSYKQYTNQRLEALHKRFAQDRTHAAPFCPPLLQQINCQISKYAWHMVLEQYQFAREHLKYQLPLAQCRKWHLRVLGLPCKHKMVELMQNGIPVGLNNINCHWHIDYNFQLDQALQEGLQLLRDAVPVFIHDPPIPCRQERRNNTIRLPIAATGRILSRHEVVRLQNGTQQAVRRCGQCRQPGHTITTCPQRSTSQENRNYVSGALTIDSESYVDDQFDDLMSIVDT